MNTEAPEILTQETPEMAKETTETAKQACPFTQEQLEELRYLYKTKRWNLYTLAQKKGVDFEALDKIATEQQWTPKCTDLREVRAYYETHNISLTELARKFDISQQVIRYHREREKWKTIDTEKIQQELTNDLQNPSVYTYIGAKKDQTKEKLKSALSHIDLDPIVLECITESTSEELLLKAMSVHYIKKQILFCAIAARSELIKMIKLSADEEKANTNIIVAAEKVSRLFIDAGISLFGRENIQVRPETTENNYNQMSTAELLALANNLPNDTTTKQTEAQEPNACN